MRNAVVIAELTPIPFKLRAGPLRKRIVLFDVAGNIEQRSPGNLRCQIRTPVTDLSPAPCRPESLKPSIPAAMLAGLAPRIRCLVNPAIATAINATRQPVTLILSGGFPRGSSWFGISSAIVALPPIGQLAWNSRRAPGSVEGASRQAQLLCLTTRSMMRKVRYRVLQPNVIWSANTPAYGASCLSSHGKKVFRAERRMITTCVVRFPGSFVDPALAKVEAGETRFGAEVVGVLRGRILAAVSAATLSEIMSGVQKPKPLVQVACVCERVLREHDGVASLIRIVDTYTVEPPPAGNPVLPLTIFLSFKSGEVAGEHTISIRIIKPDGAVGPSRQWPLLFNGGEQGSSLQLGFVLEPPEIGLYWFDVLWTDDEVLARIPLRVQFKKPVPPIGPNEFELKQPPEQS